jgi:hypothetical protein
MNIYDKVLNKAPISWSDVHKQLSNVILTRAGGGGGLMGASSVGSTLSLGNVNSSLSSTTTTSAGGGGGGANVATLISSSSSSIAINKPFIKQCTDLLIKHIKSKSEEEIKL